MLYSLYDECKKEFFPAGRNCKTRQECLDAYARYEILKGYDYEKILLRLNVSNILITPHEKLCEEFIRVSSVPSTYVRVLNALDILQYLTQKDRHAFAVQLYNRIERDTMSFEDYEFSVYFDSDLLSYYQYYTIYRPYFDNG